MPVGRGGTKEHTDRARKIFMSCGRTERTNENDRLVNHAEFE